MDFNSILLSKQDLEHYSNRDLVVLARHRDVTATNKCDLCWLLSLDILSNLQRAGMEPAEVSLLLSLPTEMIFKVGLQMPLSDLLNICQTYSQINDILCARDLYWKTRYLQDFGSPAKKVIKWKQEYMYSYHNIGVIWVCGSNASGQLGLGNFENTSKPIKIPYFVAKTLAC